MLRAWLVALLCWLGFLAEARGEERRGLAVLARDAAVVPAAEALARSLYREPRLRPALDEATVRELLGSGASEPVPPRAAELGRVARAAVGEADPAIAARLLRGLGAELGVAQLVLVEGPASRPGARVFAVGEGRFLGLSLAPVTATPVTAAPTPPSAEAGQGASPAAAPSPPDPAWDWSDAVVALRAVATPPLAPTAPVPLAPPARPVPGSPRPGEERGQPATPLLSSPWFWGGLAAVVTVGVTVLVLSRTALDAPGTVVLEGRIAP